MNAAVDSSQHLSTLLVFESTIPNFIEKTNKLENILLVSQKIQEVQPPSQREIPELTTQIVSSFILKETFCHSMTETGGGDNKDGGSPTTDYRAKDFTDYASNIYSNYKRKNSTLRPPLADYSIYSF